MYDCTRNYINGEWVNSTAGDINDIINPATEESIGKVSFGTARDVDLAVAAARAAFEEFSQWTVEQRLELLGAIVDAYKTRWNDIAVAITAEMGAPAAFSQRAQTGSGLAHLRAAIAALQGLELEETVPGIPPYSRSPLVSAG